MRSFCSRSGSVKTCGTAMLAPTRNTAEPAKTKLVAAFTLPRFADSLDTPGAKGA
jgi:hypothetical protein